MRKYIILLLVIIIFIMLGIQQVQSQIDQEINTKNKNKVANKINICNNIMEPEIITGNNYIVMQATAYDLSKRCCGKSYNNPSRGITRDGYNLNNKSHRQAYTVASNKFLLGTRLRLTFPESHKQYDGIYTCRDTGNFEENVLDVYVGDFGEKVHKNTIKFGRVDVKVEVIN